MIAQKRSKKEIALEYSEMLQETARQEKQAANDEMAKVLFFAQKEFEERKAVEAIRLAELRKQNEADAAKEERRAIRALYPALPDADFDRLFPQLRDKFLVEKSTAMLAQQRFEYSKYI